MGIRATVISLSFLPASALRVLFLTFDSSHFLQFTPILNELINEGHEVDFTFPSDSFNSAVAPLISPNNSTRLTNIATGSSAAAFVDFSSIILEIPASLTASLTGIYNGVMKSLFIDTGKRVIDYYTEKKSRPDIIIMDMFLNGLDQLAYPGGLLPPDSLESIPVLNYISCRPSALPSSTTFNDVRHTAGLHLTGRDTFSGFFDLGQRVILETIVGTLMRTISAAETTSVKTQLTDYALAHMWNFAKPNDRELFISSNVKPAFHIAEHLFAYQSLAVGSPEMGSHDWPYVKYIGAPDALRADAQTSLLGPTSFIQSDLDAFLSKSAEMHIPVVYMSFGSLLCVPKSGLFTFLDILADPQHTSGIMFLWSARNAREANAYLATKFLCDASALSIENDNTFGFLPLCQNIRILSRVDQKQLLNHPAVKVFVNHGGFNSGMEALISGVPMVIAPQFSDQSSNSYFFEYVVGNAKSVSNQFFKGNTESTLQLISVIKHIISDKSNWIRMHQSALVFGNAIKSQTNTSDVVSFIKRCAKDSYVDPNGKTIHMCGIRSKLDVHQGFGVDFFSAFFRLLFGPRITALLIQGSVDLYIFFLGGILVILSVVVRVIFLSIRKGILFFQRHLSKREISIKSKMD